MAINKNLKNHPWFKNAQDKRLNQIAYEKLSDKLNKKIRDFFNEHYCNECKKYHCTMIPNRNDGYDFRYWECDKDEND